MFSMILNKPVVAIPLHSFARAVSGMFPGKGNLDRNDLAHGWHRHGALLPKTPARDREDYAAYWHAGNTVQHVGMNFKFSKDGSKVLIPADKFETLIEVHPDITRSAHAFALAVKNDPLYHGMASDEPCRKLALFSLRLSVMFESAIRPKVASATETASVQTIPAAVPA